MKSDPRSFFILIALMTWNAAMSSGMTYVMAPLQFISGFVWKMIRDERVNR